MILSYQHPNVAPLEKLTWKQVDYSKFIGPFGCVCFVKQEFKLKGDVFKAWPALYMRPVTSPKVGWEAYIPCLGKFVTSPHVVCHTNLLKKADRDKIDWSGDHNYVGAPLDELECVGADTSNQVPPSPAPQTPARQLNHAPTQPV